MHEEKKGKDDNEDAVVDENANEDDDNDDREDEENDDPEFSLGMQDSFMETDRINVPTIPAVLVTKKVS